MRGRRHHPAETMPSCRLPIRLIPGASRDTVDGLYDGSIKIRLKAPPVEGKANRALVSFLAKRLGCRSRDLILVAGQTSRRKVVEIQGMDEATALKALVPAPSDCSSDDGAIREKS